MTIERATKAVERLDAIGGDMGFDTPYEREQYKEAMIRRLVQMDESELRPDFIEVLDMSDFKFNLMAPILKKIVSTAVEANRRTIEENLRKMMSEQTV